MSDPKILTGKPLNTFLRYLIPSFGAMLISCVYSIADTFFIGRYEGEAGITALIIIIPVYMLLYGIGALFGVGGSILYSIEKGRGTGNEKKYFTASLTGALIIALILMAVLNIWFTPIMNFMGEKPSREVMALIEVYGRYVAFGAPVIALNGFLTIFLRNDGAPALSMIAVVSTGVLNILGDYIAVFVLNMGMEGAALTTISCMAISAAICSIHFFRKKCGLGLRFKGALKAIPLTLLRGLPTFTGDFSFAITMMTFTIMFKRHIGAYAQVVYSVLCNIVAVQACLFMGVCAAVQPLISTNFGAKNRERVLKFFRLGLITTGILAVIMYVMILIFPSALAGIFLEKEQITQQVLDMTPVGARIYGLCLLFLGFNFLINIYYQSTLRTAVSLTVTFSRGLILVLVFIFLLPAIFPNYLYALWWAVPLADALTLGLIAAYAFFKKKKRLRAAAAPPD